MRRLSGTKLYVAFEDPLSHSLAPLLDILGLAVLPARLAHVDESMRVSPVRLYQIVPAVASLARASISTVAATRSAKAELATLARQHPTFAKPVGKRVLYLNTNLWFGLKAGGSVAHVAGVVNGLVRAGLQVELRALSRPPLVSPTVIFREIPMSRVLGLPSELNQYVVQRAVVADIVERRRSSSYGFIYQRLSVHSFAGALLARHLNVPLVVEYNGSEVWIARNWGRPLRYETLALRAERELLRHASLVVTVSDVLARDVAERGVPRERIFVHPNGFDPHLFNPSEYSPSAAQELRAKLGIPAQSVVVVFIGTFGRWHGTEVFAQAIRDLVTSSAPWLDAHAVRFLIVGDGLKMPEVRAMVAGAAEPYVVLTGLIPQAEAPKYLALADIAVSPHVSNEDSSDFFGSPTKLFEYMGMGKPVIASDLGQIGRVLRPCLRVATLPSRLPGSADQNLAVLVRPGSVGDLESAIRFLVEQPAWRRALGEHARAEALSKYTWDQQVKHILYRLGGRETR
jgi:glycosyltransferase involved in cell wall biosynthesis